MTEPIVHTGGEGTSLHYYTLEYMTLVYHQNQPDHPTYEEIGRSEFLADLQALVDQYDIKLLDPNDEYYGWKNGFVIREHFVDTGYKVDVAKLEEYAKKARGE